MQYGGNGQDRFSSLLDPVEQLNLAKELVEPGKTNKHTLFRTRLNNDDQAKEIIGAMSELVEMGLKDELDDLMNLLAAFTSVGSQGNHNRAYMLLEALTGLLMAEEKHGLLGRRRKTVDEKQQQTTAAGQ